MNIHLHKKKTLVFVCIVVIKTLAVLFVYVNVDTSKSVSYIREDRYEYLQQKKLLTLQEALKDSASLDKSIYDLKKVNQSCIIYWVNNLRLVSIIAVQRVGFLRENSMNRLSHWHLCYYSCLRQWLIFTSDSDR